MTSLTRKKTKLRVIEKFPEKMKCNNLPTYEDVLRHYEWVRHEMKRSNNKEPQAKRISSEVVRAIIEIWNKASIPTVTEVRVNQLLLSYCNQYRQLLKNYDRVPKSQSYLDKIHNFITKSAELFDIASCKCKEFRACKCGKSKTVPVKERSFLVDQRTVRRMAIGNIDAETTKKLQNKCERSQRQQKSMEPQPCTSKSICMSSSDNEAEISIEDEDYQHKDTSNKGRKRKIPSIALDKLSEICDRYGVSYRAGAAIASATLSDTKDKSSNSPPTVIDHNKLRRDRVKRRRTLLKNRKLETLEALFFDGRKDQTLYCVKDKNKFYRRIRVEEHITMIQEPGSIYLGHVTPPTGTSKDIEQAMFSYLSEKNINLDSLVAIGCDGTNTNTGRKNGIIVQLERRFGKPMQWLICQLHANELPLRHLIQHLDGKTTGPVAFSGPIGKLLKTCETREITRFEPIAVCLPDLSKIKLSSDQQYLYDMCVAVSTGSVSYDLAKRFPGKMSHARWLTTANRILRLYVSTEQPTNELMLMANYICKTYSPTWFQIKINSSCKDGARNLWFLIKSSRYLSEDIKALLDPVIERNAYFAHPENLLLSMLTDDNKHIRELGCRRIIKARGLRQATMMRSFVIPKINFECQNYYDMIDWQNKSLVLTEPPLLRNLETDDLKKIVVEGNIEKFDFPKFPCHTQSVERCVKLTTEAAGSVAGQVAREGYIACKQNSRQIMPKFNSKKDFK
ncbi:hypothetical protein B5X24_HaOG202589 [Helicoverpa armigera]|uniref:Uncharacterized protein n=1 Tax=Helicoverpa armigera TaxID=29058 RepID=A0A2W1BSV2_HELAM|nr:hypothetical protein B5X24_HaOG202589 [Helicoverpa armigera]